MAELLPAGEDSDSSLWQVMYQGLRLSLITHTLEPFGANKQRKIFARMLLYDALPR